MSIIKTPFKFKTEIDNELKKDFMKININGVPIKQTEVEVNFFKSISISTIELYEIIPVEYIFRKN